MNPHDQASTPGQSVAPTAPTLPTPTESAVAVKPEPPPGHYPYPYPYPYPPHAYRSTSGIAVLSLIMGILSYIVLPFAGALIAILTGHLARSEIRRNPDRLEGSSMALVGLVLGYVNLLACALVVLLSLLILGRSFYFLHLILEQLNGFLEQFNTALS